MKKLVTTAICLCSFSIHSYALDGLDINNSSYTRTIASKDHILIVDEDNIKFMPGEEIVDL